MLNPSLVRLAQQNRISCALGLHQYSKEKIEPYLHWRYKQTSIRICKTLIDWLEDITQDQESIWVHRDKYAEILKYLFPPASKVYYVTREKEILYDLHIIFRGVEIRPESNRTGECCEGI